jgi:hypothetical protein
MLSVRVSTRPSGGETRGGRSAVLYLKKLRP